MALRHMTSARLLLCLSLILTTATACTVREISKQAAMVDNAAALKGTVEVEADGDTGQIYVLLFRFTGTSLEAVSFQLLSENGNYFFEVPPGKYTVGAFLDSDGDGKRSDGEWTTYLGEESRTASLIEIKDGQPETASVLRLKGLLTQVPEIPVVANFTASVTNIGQLASLKDARFSIENSSIGLWRPADFLNTVGAGLFMLQEFESGKIPVIFVHGINGSPANFIEPIASLDRDQFQPWVLHYPSGIRLDMVSDYFVQAVDQLQATQHFDEFYVVAHSMGGLMTRSFVYKYKQANSAARLSLLVTINSPLYGIESAAIGVKTSPLVLPVWRDVATDSDYVQRVHAKAWPSDFPYHLIFSYQEGKEGDGVVPLRSQLSRSLQREARKIHGFNAEHSAILKDPDFIAQLNQILSQAQH